MSSTTPPSLETQNEPNHLALKATPCGTNGAADVTCVLGDRIVHRDRFVPAKASDRRRFAAAIIEKLGDACAVDSGMLNQELIRVAEQLDARDSSGDMSGQSAQDLTELPASSVTRPELIIRQDLSAIAIPKLCQAGDKVVGEWAHYMRIGQERRCEIVTDRLSLPGDEILWLSPQPADPTAGDVRDFNRWSVASRQQWLEGAVTPSTSDVLRLVAERIDRYIVLPPPYAKEHGLTLAAWVMMTYVYPALPAVPYLYLSGPANSGKTRTMDVLSRLVFRPLMTGNATAATIFRSKHAYGGVMLLDEVERMGDSRSPDVLEIRSILLTGYRRGGRASRMEPSGDTYRTASFDCYGPVVLGAIRGLPPALASRCITVRLLRASKGDPQSNRSMDDSPVDATRVLDALHCWAIDYGHQAISSPMPSTSLANRDAELWGPLMQIVAHTKDGWAIHQPSRTTTTR